MINFSIFPCQLNFPVGQFFQVFVNDKYNLINERAPIDAFLTYRW